MLLSEECTSGRCQFVHMVSYKTEYDLGPASPLHSQSNLPHRFVMKIKEGNITDDLEEIRPVDHLVQYPA